MSLIHRDLLFLREVRVRLSQHNHEDQVAQMGYCNHTVFSKSVSLTLPNNTWPKAAAFCTGESPFQSLCTVIVNLQQDLSLAKIFIITSFAVYSLGQFASVCIVAVLKMPHNTILAAGENLIVWSFFPELYFTHSCISY